MQQHRIGILNILKHFIGEIIGKILSTLILVNIKVGTLRRKGDIELRAERKLNIENKFEIEFRYF